MTVNLQRQEVDHVLALIRMNKDDALRMNKENDAFPVPAAKELLQLLNALTDTMVITKPAYN